MGAAFVWETPRGCTGQSFHLGTNKEAFGAEIYAIYRALRVLNRKQESGHWYTVFVDATCAIEMVVRRHGPKQRFAAASNEICSRILERDNDVTTR